MSIRKAFRVLAVVLVASFVPATALATPTTAGAPTAVAQQAQGARLVRGKNIKIKAAKADKAGKMAKKTRARKAGKAARTKIVRRAAR